jgi:ferritin-like metal-binding protein YciE
MAQESGLKKILIDELRDIYHAEKQLVKALPKMAKAATSPDLRAAIESHLEETEEHVNRLEQAFDLLEQPVKAKPCAGMAGIIEEGSDVIREEDKGPVLDAAIVAGAQRAEHYEMAAYGSVIAWAKALGHDDVATLLEETLDEEKAADEKLTELAEGGINADAAGEGEDAEETGAESEEAGSGQRRPVMARRASSARGAATRTRH